MPPELPLPYSVPAVSNLHKLPRELMDQIIIHLVQTQSRADVVTAKRTMAGCSLASRIFVPSCRYAMLNFSLTTEPGFTKIGYDEEEVERFIELMDSPVQTIGMGLRRVKFVTDVSMGRRKVKRGGLPSGRAREGHILKVTQRTVEALQNVASIHLEGVPPAPASSGVANTFWRLIDVLRGVKEVQVEAGGLMGNSRLLEWVCDLPELGHLSVTGSRAGVERREPVFRDDMLRFKLTNADKMKAMLVEIGGQEELGILRWLLAQSPVPRVRSVRVRSPLRGCWDGGRYEDGPQLVKRFFQVCGSSIEHLCVVVPKKGDFGDVLEIIDLGRCDNLHSVHIEGIQVGSESVAGREQWRALEMLLEKIFIESPVGPQVNRVALSVQIDPHIRNAFAFFSISDVALFKDFEWGRVPYILKGVRPDSCGRDGRRQNHAHGAAGGGDKWSYQSDFAHRSEDITATGRKELVMIIQGGSKYGRERLVDVLRGGVFRVFDESLLFAVYFDTEGTQPRGCYL